MSPRILIPVLLLVAAAFTPALLGGYVYDDLIVVERATRIAASGAWERLLFEPFFGNVAPYWRPLTSSLLVLGDGIGGPSGIHALALLLHLGAVTAAFGIARELRLTPVAAGLAALLFGLHPVQVESVAWASALNDVLYGGLSLAAIWATLSWRRRGARGLPWLSLSLALLALLAKENALIAPLLVIAAAVLPVPCKSGERQDAASGSRPCSRQESSRIASPAASLASRLLRSLVPSLLVLAVFFGARMAVFGSAAAGLDRVQLDASYSAGRALIAPAWIFSQLLLTLAWPWPMTPFRTVPLALGGWSHMLQILLPLLVAAGLLIWLRRKPGTWLLAALLFAPILLVSARFDALGAHPVSDRYLYPGVFVLAAGLAFWAKPYRSRQLALLLLAIGGAGLSSWQCTRWQTQQSLVSHGIRFSPKDPALSVMQGNALLRENPPRVDAALQSFYKALRQLSDRGQGVPASPESSAMLQHRSLVDAYVGVGMCELQMAQRGGPAAIRSAQSHFAKALNHLPSDIHAWTGRGIAHAMLGERGEAERSLRRALQIDGAHVPALFNLARLLHLSGRNAQARVLLQSVLRLQPEHAAARQMLTGR
ncbi:MAG: hypothetical protein CSA62_06115 [Planctomycetota bacterium]|nr:MAG: hypothetical protein CSA62_06115 [Planctomycetota bacterium]